MADPRHRPSRILEFVQRKCSRRSQIAYGNLFRVVYHSDHLLKIMGNGRPAELKSGSGRVIMALIIYTACLLHQSISLTLEARVAAAKLQAEVISASRLSTYR